MEGKVKTEDFFSSTFPVIISSELAHKFGISVGDTMYAGAGLAGEMKMITDTTDSNGGYFMEDINNTNITLRVIGILVPSLQLNNAANNIAGLKLSDCFILPLPLLNLIIDNLYVYSDSFSDDSIKYAEYTVANRADAIGLSDYASTKGVNLKSYKLYSSAYDDVTKLNVLKEKKNIYQKFTLLSGIIGFFELISIFVYLYKKGKRRNMKNAIINT
jgi:hypothetical protein